ncbi:amino acid transporter [Piedraia hortae CBS 480.64]|uniref:Amino acid transporter n=1 Tax=Piedraia hortae CBS 480.64 TaxID=1314780 RepID=A0A6A7BZM3_9PEZI|nr:amino acid transporter [Piedraia hortae CBS 480.64]
MVPEHRKSVAEEPVTSVLANGDVPIIEAGQVWDVDEEVLASLGYKPEFKRDFSFWSVFSVSFAVLGLLPSFGTTLYYTMGFAGTAAMSWGWLVSSIGVTAVALSMAELCSSMPTAGGLYYAAAALAPSGWGPLAAWITGWSNWIAGLSGAPSVNYGVASMMLAMGNMHNADFVPTRPEKFLLTLAIMVVHAFMASLPTKWAAFVNNMGTLFNIVGIFVVIILIPTATNRTSRGLTKFNHTGDVWGQVYHGTDFPDGISVLMSFSGIVWAVSGYDAPLHLTEECDNANVACPRAIVLTSVSGCLVGWVLQLVVAYTIVDIPGILSSDTAQPFAAYLDQCLPRPAAYAVLSLTIFGVFPFSTFFAHVNQRTKTPVNSVLLNFAVGCILLFLIFGGDLAVGAIFSVGACSAFISFGIPIFIRVLFVRNRFRSGPWNLGRLSIPIGTMAVLFVALMTPILCLPARTGKELNAQTMNWTSVVYLSPMAMCLIWWVLGARKWFKGPKNQSGIWVDRLRSSCPVVEGAWPAVGGKKHNPRNPPGTKHPTERPT